MVAAAMSAQTPLDPTVVPVLLEWQWEQMERTVLAAPADHVLLTTEDVATHAPTLLPHFNAAVQKGTCLEKMDSLVLM